MLHLLEVLRGGLQHVRVPEEYEDGVGGDRDDALAGKFELHVLLYLEYLSFCG